MKILMLLTYWFPPDSRVEKEAASLTDAGHEVHILCYSKPGQLPVEQKKSYTIHRFDCSDFFFNKLSALALIFPGYFKKWRKEVATLHSKYHFDAIHVHDLPLSKVGYYFKQKYGLRLICDQHEFYSDWIKKTAHMNTPQGKIVNKMSNWRMYEKKYLSLADLVITVENPLRENYIRKYNLPEQKIITIPNTPTNRIFNAGNIDQKIVEKYNSQFIIFYAGGIDILRGIDTAIIALKRIKESIPNVKLLLGGKIVKPYDPFKVARNYNVEDIVEFTGWINEKDLPSYIAASKVCFFTPPANRDEIHKTIATKVYQYAIMNKPIVVSDAKLMKEFVEHNHLGYSIQTNNSDQFAEAVLKIYKEDLQVRYQSTGSIFWEETVKPLLSAYKSFENN